MPAFLSDGPRIAALWTDLDLSAFGTAYFDATPTVVYFTWIDAADFSNPTLRSTFQIQLFADGRIKLCYQNLNVGATRPVLAGYGLGGEARQKRRQRLDDRHRILVRQHADDQVHELDAQ